ncbi:hypothetical protein LJB95_01080 [Paludibacteraceae bacterium OttesenSCG-928-F17]|nr:hypothetical protein [Paludibacteraceae bacterium OttesenSCG-928-F17]
MKYKVLILLIIVSCISCKQKNQLNYYSIFNDDLAELREGDLAFRKGRGTATRFVNLADKNTVFSHVGILVKNTAGNWFVIHAVPGEQEETGGKEMLKIDSVNIFFSSDRATAGAIYRLPLSLEKSQKIAEESTRLLEKEIYFDHSFNTEDTTQLYCTELIHFIFTKVGEDITEGKRHTIPAFKYELIFPSDILKNEKLIEICNFKDIK